MLKDGSDSVGALGALNRVYINIGLFSEEWLTHFRRSSAARPISPIEIAVARKNSVVLERHRAADAVHGALLPEGTEPHHLKDAPGGAAYLDRGRRDGQAGKVVFAERCARCHSSKMPPLPAGLDMENCNGKDYLAAWNRYWAWTKTDAFKNRCARSSSPTTS